MTRERGSDELRFAVQVHAWHREEFEAYKRIRSLAALRASVQHARDFVAIIEKADWVDAGFGLADGYLLGARSKAYCARLGRLLALHEQQVWDAVALKIDSMDEDARAELTDAIERADLDALLREVDEDGDG